MPCIVITAPSPALTWPVPARMRATRPGTATPSRPAPTPSSICTGTSPSGPDHGRDHAANRQGEQRQHEDDPVAARLGEPRRQDRHRHHGELRHHDRRAGERARVAGAARDQRLAEQRQHRGVAEMKQQQGCREHEQRLRGRQRRPAGGVAVMLLVGQAARGAVIDPFRIDEPCGHAATPTPSPPSRRTPRRCRRHSRTLRRARLRRHCRRD